MPKGIEASTLATAEGVQDAAAILATFRSIAGETFTRTLGLAQDLAAVFGQDLRSSAVQLGKALEDPVQGITALRRVGVSFSASQRELIGTLVETGQVAEAQRLILDALERQVGGAGSAEATGLTGATNRLADAWGNLLEAIGRTPAFTRVVEGTLADVSQLLEGLTGALEDDPIAERIARAADRLTRAREDLARLQAGGPGTPMLGQRFALEEQQERVRLLEAELEALQRLKSEQDRQTAAEQARADAGRAAADAEQRAERLATMRRELDAALAQIATDPAERIARINRELAQTRARLDALRAPDNAAAVDAAIADAERIARRKIEAIEKPAAEAARRAAEADAKVVGDLAQRLETIGNARQAYVDRALERLSTSATAETRAEVERLAAAMYDEQQQREARDEALRREQQLMREGARITEQARTPLEELGATVQNLNALHEAGALNGLAYSRALADAYETAAQKSTAWQDGLTRGVKAYADEASDAARVAEDAVSGSFAGMGDALADFVATGKVDFAGLVDSMIADLTRLSIRMAVLAPLAKAFGGGLAALFGGGAGYGTTGAGTSPAGMTSGGTNPGFLLGGVATGGAFDRGRLVEAYARGGIVDRPTVFPMARGYGLMGEAGPEAVMPLKRLASGKLGVAATSGRGDGQRDQQRRRPGHDRGAPGPGGGLTIDVLIDAVETQMAARLARPGTQLNGALRVAANPHAEALMPTWPATLPQAPLVEGYSETAPDLIVRTRPRSAGPRPGGGRPPGRPGSPRPTG